MLGGVLGSAWDVLLDLVVRVDLFVFIFEQDVVRIAFRIVGGDCAVEGTVSGKELAHFGLEKSRALFAKGIVVVEAIELRLTRWRAIFDWSGLHASGRARRKCGLCRCGNDLLFVAIGFRVMSILLLRIDIGGRIERGGLLFGIEVGLL